MLRTSLVVCAIVVLSSACSGPNAVLRLGMVPSQEPESLMETFEPIRLYLERELDMPVSLSVPRSYGELIRKVEQNNIDIAYFGAFSYVLAEQEQELEPLVVRVRRGFGVSYNSLFITRADSPIESIADLQGERFAFVDSASTSGFMIPLALFTSRGIDYTDYFSSYWFSGSHDQVVEDVINRKVDAGAVSKSLLTGMIDAELLAWDDIRVLWESEDIPGSLFCGRSALPERIKERFTEAMLNLSEQNPEALVQYDRNIEGYVPATPEMYNSIRNIVAVLGNEYIGEKFLQ